MKITSKEIMVLNVAAKKKQSGEDYLSIGIASVDDGSVFTVSSTNMDLANLEPFSKHVADFTVTDSKYGMRLSVDNIY